MIKLINRSVRKEGLKHKLEDLISPVDCAIYPDFPCSIHHGWCTFRVTSLDFIIPPLLSPVQMVLLGTRGFCHHFPSPPGWVNKATWNFGCSRVLCHVPAPPPSPPPSSRSQSCFSSPIPAWSEQPFGSEVKSPSTGRKISKFHLKIPIFNKRCLSLTLP